jgi:hypothetical protein
VRGADLSGERVTILGERRFLGAASLRQRGPPGAVLGALTSQPIELAARAADGFLGFLDLARELVATAGVALHRRAHLVDLRAHGFEVRLGLCRGGVLGAGQSG